LQNSDDAQSKAVEIRFETHQFLDRKNGKTAQEVPTEGEKEILQNLKNVQVCHLVEPLTAFTSTIIGPGAPMDFQKQWNCV
jgi:hypothetical protein